jgi:hypothetical protein
VTCDTLVVGALLLLEGRGSAPTAFRKLLIIVGLFAIYGLWKVALFACWFLRLKLWPLPLPAGFVVRRRRTGRRTEEMRGLNVEECVQ